MASTSRSGAGGKIVKNRRKLRLSGTPYDRPQPPPPPPLKSPNWFSDVVVPSARAVATGAGKFLSSVFTESESSSEDEDYDSEEDIENEFPDGVNANKKKVVSSELMLHGEGSQLNVMWTGSKRIIEKLIFQETFTREECDSMIKVLNSRVVDRSNESVENSFRVGSLEKNFEDVDMYNKVAQEAKKWFKDKKAGSTSATELTPGTSKVQSGEASPVDVARSYMKERPRWESPTLSVDVRTPLSSKLFRDGASYSIGYDSFSSSKKRSGSWNFQEELQRVRAKATEDMLRTPSKKLDPLIFAPTSSGEGRLGAGRLVLSGPKNNYSEFVNTTGPVDVLVSERVSSNPVFAALESRQDGMTNEALPSHIDATFTKNNQDSEVICADDALLCSKDTSVQNHDVENQNDPNSITEFLGRQSANGVLSSQPRVELGQNHEQQHNVENHDTAHVTDKNPVMNTTNNIQANSEISSETYPEVPIVTETASLASDPKNDLRVQNEGLSIKDDAEGLSIKDDAEIAVGKKSSKPSRRGKGRGLSKG